MVALSHLFTYFNSRPHGGRLFYRKLALRPHYFNSRPHGGRPSASPTAFCCADALISTHALTEGDAVLPGMYRRTAHFNSRPHGGRRTSYTVSYECLKFQLTPSRRATIDKDVIIAYNIFQLTPSRRATFTSSHALFIIFDISTHALTEGDGLSLLSFPVRCYFNSRPHGGRQYPGFAGSMTSPHFNSRPHGGRRQI